MSVANIRIQKVEAGFGKNSGKPYRRVQDDHGRWYGVVFPNMFEDMVEGRVLEVEVEETTFNNKPSYRIMEVLGESKEAPPKPSSPPVSQSKPSNGQSDTYWDDRQKSIEVQASIKMATAWIKVLAEFDAPPLPGEDRDVAPDVLKFTAHAMYNLIQEGKQYW